MANWTRLSDAAREVGVSQAKLSRLVKNGKLAHEKSPFDERVTLVDIDEVRRMFPSEKRFRR